jgi:hypothetical protein
VLKLPSTLQGSHHDATSDSALDLDHRERPYRRPGRSARRGRVFFSPAVFTPQEGRDKAATYLKAAAKVFGDTDFHYVEHWYKDQSAILEFAATIDGIYVNGIDMIHWNDDEQIVSFKVMLRPLKALQTVIPAMAELLQQ